MPIVHGRIKIRNINMSQVKEYFVVGSKKGVEIY
jgi:hypothetical protein